MGSVLHLPASLVGLPNELHDQIFEHVLDEFEPSNVLRNDANIQAIITRIIDLQLINRDLTAWTPFLRDLLSKMRWLSSKIQLDLWRFAQLYPQARSFIVDADCDKTSWSVFYDIKIMRLPGLRETFVDVGHMDLYFGDVWRWMEAGVKADKVEAIIRESQQLVHKPERSWLTMLFNVPRDFISRPRQPLSTDRVDFTFVFYCDDTGHWNRALSQMKRHDHFIYQDKDRYVTRKALWRRKVEPQFLYKFERFEDPEREERHGGLFCGCRLPNQRLWQP